jgi:hypothetical protein
MKATEGDEALEQVVLEGFCAAIPFGGGRRGRGDVAIHELVGRAIFIQLRRVRRHVFDLGLTASNWPAMGPADAIVRSHVIFPAGSSEPEFQT